jgi:hypothetical protein
MSQQLFVQRVGRRRRRVDEQLRNEHQQRQHVERRELERH